VAPANISAVISGTGSLVNIGSANVPLTGANTYSGSTTISNGSISLTGSSTLGDGTGTLNLSGGTLTTTASRTASSAPVPNPINVTADSAITTASASSTVDLNLTNNSIGGSAGTLTFSNAAVSGTGIFQPRFSGSGFNFSRPMIIANGGSGTTRVDSFNTTGTTQTFSGAISGTGSYRRTASISGTGGTTVLSGINTYTGATDVNQGVLVVNGTLGASTVTVAANGTLGGNGTLNGPVTISGNLSPGSSIGTLTISNTLTFQSSGTHNAELNKTLGTNDLVRGITTVAYAGTLVVNNLSGTLAANDTFKLFDAANYTGSFTATNLPALDAGLAWDTTGLTANGTIKVVSVGGGQPTLNFTQTGNNLQFTWTGGFKLQSQTNSLATGLTGTWFDYPNGGTSPVNTTNNPANPSVFYRLISTP
jgi:autotransporter-associated beta strand protein